MVQPEEILSFWLQEVGPKGWYDANPDLDSTIRDRFGDIWRDAQGSGSCKKWMTNARSALAYIILMDQFPRNMFRGTAQAFASDRVALAAAKLAIDRKWDLRIPEPERQFFYLPLMHSENLCDQERCVRLMLERMPETGSGNLLHAKAHREVIRLFGRFPYRNEALSRRSTTPERDYVSDGGYGTTVQSLQAG
ncbi:MAG: DUF924 domain-containing protein [Sediminimonas qiaohouensis]|uniref:DUF924 domain-containing protein n=1 Tax=Sediminimonas qiaohouensis TaxID=552061 RepID=A0A7C9L751_9RHOB|nr:DUF924 family protein [Sediminimonas qiaohouensis]MTJ04313.1 DUF924 domain-containing protein [Sediminimonas qiaohouensis]